MNTDNCSILTDSVRNEKYGMTSVSDNEQLLQYTVNIQIPYVYILLIIGLTLQTH